MKAEEALHKFCFDHEKQTLYLDELKIKGLKHYEIKNVSPKTEELTLKLEVVISPRLHE